MKAGSPELRVESRRAAPMTLAVVPAPDSPL